MKLIIFIGIELLAALVIAMRYDYVIDTPIMHIRPAWIAFCAAMGALAGMYKAQISQWLKTNDQLNDERNMMEVYKFRVEEKDQIIRIKDITIDKMQQYANEDKKTIERLQNQLLIECQENYDIKIKNQCFVGVILENVKYVAFISAYQNNGATMSQNALAGRLGMSRAKVRRTADKINKLVGYDFIRRGEAKVKVKSAEMVKEVADPKKPYELGFDQFEGLNIPSNWMDKFEMVKDAANKRETTCGCYDDLMIMDCGTWHCLSCICHKSNNDAARRLIAKVEMEMKDKEQGK